MIALLRRESFECNLQMDLFIWLMEFKIFVVQGMVVGALVSCRSHPASPFVVYIIIIIILLLFASNGGDHHLGCRQSRHFANNHQINKLQKIGSHIRVVFGAGTPRQHGRSKCSSRS
jgi:hypothetical protein